MRPGKGVFLSLFAVFVLICGNLALPAAAQRTGSAPAAPAPPASAKTPTAQQPPSANSNGMVWVNADSGVYHQPGTRWYDKTKQGKYMSEADAQKAGYHPAAKE